jgi:hypothetical protein
MPATVRKRPNGEWVRVGAPVAARRFVMAGACRTQTSTSARRVSAAVPTGRDALLTWAANTGRISAARRAHYAAMYDRDPAGTRAVIAALHPVKLPAPAPLTHSQVRGRSIFAASDAADERGTDPTVEEVREAQGFVRAPRGGWWTKAVADRYAADAAQLPESYVHAGERPRSARWRAGAVVKD